MTITRIDTNTVYGPGGVVLSEETVEVDVTEQVVRADLHAKARAALDDIATFLAISSPTNAQLAAELKRVVRRQAAIIRLIIGSDLLVENSDT